MANVETLTVQPKLEYNALGFGLVIPTPGQRTVCEMLQQELLFEVMHEVNWVQIAEDLLAR